MNFSTPQFIFGRQRSRQWVPLITQQFRLRHLYQIICYNLLSEIQGSFYFTLHSTTMCAPFYTSEQVDNPHPKWIEVDLRNVPNTSASCLVLRIWQNNCDGADKVVLTWGVNFSGLVYIGNKIAEIQPIYFKNNSVIFSMLGGYFTSHRMIKDDLPKPVPFSSNLNTINILNDSVIYKRIAITANKNEIQNSYNIEKLRKLHFLQIQIRNKIVDVQNIKDKINAISGLNSRPEQDCPVDSNISTPNPNIRYAPQLLTMNSLYKLLQEKPTRGQKQEMARISKQIEMAKFKIRLLSQEKDKKTVIIRQLKQKYLSLVEENEERNSDLMESYYKLSRSAEKLKEHKKNILQLREMYSQVNFQLNHRRKQLLQELLFIYPIEKTPDDKLIIHGIYLPNSDILADCSDTGLSVALGYITHVLIMCSIFLQVPLRYPLTHYGSRSYITDNVSPLLLEKERVFPLFTRGKDKTQFTYAVYLLNKNIAQLRWLVYMNTNDLRATLHNLLTFLQGQREPRPEPLFLLGGKHVQKQEILSEPNTTLNLVNTDKYVSLHSFGSISNISDPILDCIRQENQLQRSKSPTRKPVKKLINKPCRNRECGRGLSEILAVPEAYLNKQISTDSFRNYMASERHRIRHTNDKSCCENPASSSNNSESNQIEVINGKESRNACDMNGKGSNHLIEQGHDPLDPTTIYTTRSIGIHSEIQLCQKKIEDVFVIKNKRISRSLGSYTDDEGSVHLKTNFELGSEPLLNKSCNQVEDRSEPDSVSLEIQDGQKEFLEKWLENTPSLIESIENLFPTEYVGAARKVSPQSSPLMARTDALLNTKSFNLVKPRP